MKSLTKQFCADALKHGVIVEKVSYYERNMETTVYMVEFLGRLYEITKVNNRIDSCFEF